MKKKYFGTKFKITLAVLLALVIGILTAAVTDNSTSPLTNVVSIVISPLQKGATSLAEKLKDFKFYFVSADKYKEEIESLNLEIETYRSMLVDYEKDERKLEAYEEFLGLKEQNPDYQFSAASIISRTTDDIYSSFTIDKGSADGIKVNDPVIYGNALVGIISQTSETTATVFTLYNPNVNVSAYEIRTRLDCIIESDNMLAMDGYFKLTGISGTTPIVSGGIIATSGIGGKYPTDLLIGTVKEVVEDDTGISAYALIIPEIDYTELRDVFVLTDFNKD